MDQFAPYSKNPKCFIVFNIAPDKKEIKIFNYPIPFHTSRDLLRIPGVSESSIKASLLKGEIKHKILAKEITVLCSDIEMIQFNQEHKQFLQGAGITIGLEIDIPQGNLTYLWKQDIPLLGAKNSVNQTFFTPEKFLHGLYNGNKLSIEITHNGKRVFENVDYRLGESGGSGTGFDTIVFISFIPNARSFLMSSYAVPIV